MHSQFFKEHGIPDADCHIDILALDGDIPRIAFRSPGNPLIGLDLNGASQLKQKMERSGDKNGAARIDALIQKARGLKSDPIYVDASASAVLTHGAHDVNCHTLQEAKIAFDNLPPDRREIATITSRGKIYAAHEIERFHYRRSALVAGR